MKRILKLAKMCEELAGASANPEALFSVATELRRLEKDNVALRNAHDAALEEAIAVCDDYAAFWGALECAEKSTSIVLANRIRALKMKSEQSSD